MNIEANIVVDVPYDVDLSTILNQIENILTQANGMDTRINVIEMDNPISANPIGMSKAVR